MLPAAAVLYLYFELWAKVATVVYVKEFFKDGVYVGIGVCT